MYSIFITYGGMGLAHLQGADEPCRHGRQRAQSRQRFAQGVGLGTFRGQVVQWWLFCCICWRPILIQHNHNK